jgi:predicted PP-loop superfamily ATPase
MIKTVQLLLANVLCHVAANKQEFDDIVTVQGAEITELSYACANTAQEFAKKFGLNKH